MVDKEYIRNCEKERVCPECEGEIKVKEYPNFVCVECGHENNINFFDIKPEMKEKMKEEKLKRKKEYKKKKITKQFLSYKQKMLKR